MDTASARAPSTAASRVRASPQPQAGPWVTATVRPPTPAASSTVPSGSGSRAPSAGGVDGSTLRTATSTRTPSGTLITNTDGQPNCSTSRPPTVGPTAAAAALAVLHNAIEPARFPSGPS